MSKPVRPEDIADAKTVQIPAAVFDAFNAEIALRYDNGWAKVKQAAVVERLVNGGMQRSEIFSAGWLNVEEAYRGVGWDVWYEKPGFNESGDSFFEFRKRR